MELRKLLGKKFISKLNFTLTNTPVLETERLVLRSFNDNDIEAIFAIFNDKDTNKFLPWFPVKSIKEAKTFFEKQYASNWLFVFAVCQKSDNNPIGYVHIRDGDSYDFGYGLRKEYWHKGIVTEACKAVVNYLKKFGIPYITATHDVNNPRSGNVMKNIGMSYCYSYKEQWQPKNIPVTFRMYQINFDGQNNRMYKKYWNNSTVRFIEPVKP